MTSFERVFCIETRSRLFQKISENRKLQARSCLSLGWLHINGKNIENGNSVGAGAHKVGKVVRFWPNFDLILQIFRERKKGKFYMLKKVDLRTFKEI